VPGFDDDIRSDPFDLGAQTGGWFTTSRRYISETVPYKVDPSAAPPSLFRLARSKFGRRAGAPTKIRLAVAPNFSGGGGIRRHAVRKCAYIAYLNGQRK